MRRRASRSREAGPPRWLPARRGPRAARGVAAEGVEVLRAPPRTRPETARATTAAARGRPLPNGLPTVTTSGATPCTSKAYQLLPSRPRPVWTSSATTTPPRRRTASKALRKPSGGSRTPATDAPLSTKSAPTLIPRASSRAHAASTASARRRPGRRRARRRPRPRAAGRGR